MDDDAAPPPQDPPMDADDDAKPPAAEADAGGDAPPAPEGENGGDAEMGGDAPTSNTEGATTAATGEGGGEGGGNLYLRPVFLGNLSHGCLASDVEGVFQNPAPASGEGGEVRAPIPVDRVVSSECIGCTKLQLCLLRPFAVGCCNDCPIVLTSYALQPLIWN